MAEAPDLSDDVWAAVNPFPGLRSFRPAEGDRFFGRDQQIAELVARLAHVPFLAVSGASGCGKSSLVLAGVLTELRRRRDAWLVAADADGAPVPDWRPVVLRPGHRPIAHLAEALAAVLRPADGDPADDPARIDSLNGRLRLGGLGLVEAVRQARLPADARVLVVVDQFEEIFRFRRLVDPDEASAFVKLLLQAAMDPDSPVQVVITLRSDTLGACADFRGLAEAASHGGYLVPRLSREQRKAAIVKPVQMRHAQIAPRLVQRLLNDVSDDFDDLPVMQHALSRTWQHWAAHGGGSRPIDLDDYRAVGGAATALSDHADEAARSLGELGREPPEPAASGAGLTMRPRTTASGAAAGKPRIGGLVRRVFRALTERAGEGTEIRRPLAFTELCAVCDPGPEGAARVARVVERYRRADTALLVPGAEVPLSDDPVIDISHESLIRQWAQLRGWVAEEAEAAAELRRLLEDSRRHTQEDGELWRGRSLERAREWERANRPNAAWVGLVIGGDGAPAWRDAQAFLHESKRAEASTRRRERWQQWLLRGLVLAVVAVSVFAALNGRSLQAQARSRELANRALLELGLDPARSATLAGLAVGQDADNLRAQYALRQAMAVLEVAQADAIVPFRAPVQDARFTTDRRQLLVAAGREVVLLDAAGLAERHRISAPGVVHKAWMVGDKLLTVTDDWGVFLQAYGGELLSDLSCRGEGNSAYSAVASPASARLPAQLAVGCYDGELTLWQLGPDGITARHVLARGGADGRGTITALAFSADGRWLAAGSSAGQLRVWDQAKPDKPWIDAAAMRHGAAVRDLQFHPRDPSLLASAGDDAFTRVWTLDLAGRGLMPDLPLARAQHRLPHDRAVERARFVQRSDDPYRLMTVSDKRVFFWVDQDLPPDERRHDDWITEANVSDDGEYLVSASSDGTARVWSSRTAAPIAVLRGHRNEVTHAFFGPQGEVITTSRDGTLRRWRLQVPRLLAADKRWVFSARATPSGTQVVACGERVPQDGVPLAKRPQCTLLKTAGGPPATLPAVDGDAVRDLSLSADGRWALGLRQDLGVYRTLQPVLWDLDERKAVAPAWLLHWQRALLSPGQPELLTWNPLAPSGATTPTGAAALAPPAAATTADTRPAPPPDTRPPDTPPPGMPPPATATLPADDSPTARPLGGELALWPTAALTQPAPQALLRLRAPADLTQAALSPDGRWIAASQREHILLWDRRQAGRPPQRLTGHRGDVRALAFSADGRQLASTGADRTAHIWRLGEAGATVPGLELAGGHSAALTSLGFSPDGQRLVTASADNSVRVWDTANGQPLAALYRHIDAVNAVQVMPDGRGILSASDDGTVVLAPCAACNADLRTLGEQVGRVQLSADERERLDQEPSGNGRASVWRQLLSRWWPSDGGTGAAGNRGAGGTAGR